MWWGQGEKCIEEALTTVIGFKSRDDHQGVTMIYCICTLRSLNLSMGMGIWILEFPLWGWPPATAPCKQGSAKPTEEESKFSLGSWKLGVSAALDVCKLLSIISSFLLSELTYKKGFGILGVIRTLSPGSIRGGSLCPLQLSESSLLLMQAGIWEILPLLIVRKYKE